MNYRVGGRIGRFVRKSYGLLRGSPALYQADVGVIRLRPWVKTNDGRVRALSGNLPVPPPSSASPRRVPGRQVPASLPAPPAPRVVTYMPMGDC